MDESNKIFNRRLHRMRQTRIAPDFAAVDFLKRHVCELLVDRLEDMARDFPLAIECGSQHHILHEMLESSARIGTLIQCSGSESMLHHADKPCLVMDEEWLPFAADCADAVLVSGGLHWVNDLPGSLRQMQQLLKPDGLLLAVMPGPSTLQELRQSFAAVESQAGRVRPHIAPFVDVRDAGHLLQRAGFALPVVDRALLTLTYASPLQLLKELKAMGENNHLMQQEKNAMPRSLFPALCDHYQTHFSGTDGRIHATIELVVMTAWKPHASQQKPARRGSGQVRLDQLFNKTEPDPIQER